MSVIDMKGSTWGNACGWTKPGQRVHGHRTPRPQVGDVVLSEMSSGRTGRYKITKIDYCRDPKDMYFADVVWDGYHE